MRICQRGCGNVWVSVIARRQVDASSASSPCSISFKARRRRFLWEVLPVYFRINGVSLRAIGGLRLLELPYSLKVFWSPLVHRFGDRRLWILACMLGIAAVLFALPFVERRRCWRDRPRVDLGADDFIGDPGCRHRFLLRRFGRSRRRGRGQRCARFGLSRCLGFRRRRFGVSCRRVGVECTFRSGRSGICAAGVCRAGGSAD